MKDFKLIEKWIDTNVKNTNYVYELPSGLKVFVSVNSKIKYFALDCIFYSSGAYYEKSVGVPYGTAHFLEHIIAGNPNSIFKNRDKMDMYKHGTKSHPEISTNAYTSMTVTNHYGYSHNKGTERVLKYLLSTIDYPLNRIEEFIEKERSIILSEIKAHQKPEKNAYIQYINYLLGELYPEYTRYVIGNEESVKSITVDDLIKYYKSTYSTNRSIIAIHTNQKLSNDIQKTLLEFDKNSQLKHNSKNEFALEDKLVQQKFRYKHHYDEKAQGIRFCMVYYYPANNYYNYRESNLYFLMTELLAETSFEYLREQKHLVYSTGGLNELQPLNNKGRGLYFNCDLNNFSTVVEESYKVITEYWREFLYSKKGKSWFNSTLSRRIFQIPSLPNTEFAREEAISYLEAQIYGGDYIFDYKKSKEEALKLTPEDLEKFTEKFLKGIPGFWMESSHSDEEIEQILLNSTWYKKLGSNK